MSQEKPKCDLCGHESTMFHIHQKCHLGAPMRAEIENGVITLFCYVPDCGRKIGSWQLAKAQDDGGAPS